MLYQRHALFGPQVAPVEHELLLPVPHKVQRHRVLGNYKAKLFKGIVVALKPSIQRVERCETAMLFRLNATQLRIILWTGMFPAPMILKHVKQLVLILR